MIIQPVVEPMDSFTALIMQLISSSTELNVVLQLVWARPPLRSLLPATPLQPPDSWAWGTLANGRVFTADTGPRGTGSSYKPTQISDTSK